MSIVGIKKLAEILNNNPELKAKLLKQLDKKTKVVWEPTTISTKYILTEAGEVKEATGCYVEPDIASQGNYFLYKGEARQARDYRKVMYKLRQQTKGFLPNWDKHTSKFCIAYDGGGIGKFVINSRIFLSNPGQVYYRTNGDAQAALDSLTDKEKEILEGGYPVPHFVEKD